MKQKKRLIRVLIQLFVLILIVSFSMPVYAAKGGKPAPDPVPPQILTTVLTLSAEPGQVITFSLTAKSKNYATLTWAAEPEGLTEAGIVLNTRKTTSTVTYSFQSNIPAVYTYQIYAIDGTLTSAPATVAITVRGVVPPAELNYLALGDSIAAGTDNESIRNAIIRQIEVNSTLFSLLLAVQDLTAHPENYLIGSDYRYTYQFRDYLQAFTGRPVKFTDLSVGGYTTADLLAQVRVNTGVIAAAEVISISIGGNDILAAGSASGFSQIDATQFDAISAMVRSNLDATLTIIRGSNPTAKIILMNFLNLYHPEERTLQDVNVRLYDQADDFLNPTDSAIGNIFKDMKAKHGLILADTYTLFEMVNSGSSTYPTAGTYTARTPLLNPPYQMDPMTTFPARFLSVSGAPVKSPFNAWDAYQTEWNRLAANNYIVKNFVPTSGGVTIDLYTHFYNPSHYVFGHDEANSDLINMIKAKYGAFAWLIWGGSVLDSIEPFESWRDVHCTSLGHSLIARAHIEAWNQALP